MRRKFLSLIVSFLLMSIAISSCLGSDDEYDASADPTVHAFSLDTIRGVNYHFAIDQLNRLIYNTDSLPLGADTIIDSIRIDTFFVTGYVTSGELDTILNIENYQDLSGAASGNGLRFRVHAADMATYRDYQLKINIHRQDPDSLQCEQPVMLPAGNNSIDKVQKSVLWDGNLWVYVHSFAGVLTAYHAPADRLESGWTEEAVNLPADADISSLMRMEGEASAPLEENVCLLVKTDGGDVYRSADGVNWTLLTGLSGSVEALLTCYNDELIGIVEDENGVSRFAVAASDLSAWSSGGEAVPEGFPREHIYAALFQTSNLLEQVMLVGATDNEKIIPWAFDGHTWAEMDPQTSYDAYCLTSQLGYNPAILRYGDQFYMFGERMQDICTSGSGLAWSRLEEKFLLPDNIGAGVSYSLAMDGDNYLYLVASSPNYQAFYVWRGRLNKLGFAIQ